MSEWLSPLVEMGVLTLGLVELLGIGGPVVAILLVFSMVAVTLIVGKSLQLLLVTWQSKTKVSNSLSLWRDGQVRDAHSLLMTSQQPVPALVASAMASVMRHGDAPLVREELARQASRHSASLKSYLKPLEVIATLSPLLGLLGTVMGMILAFQQMEAAGNQVDPSVLSGGIWQALLTTAAGLIVAIPVVMLHSYLERKTDRLVDDMEDALTAVFTGPLVGNTSGAVNVSEPAANPLNASDERRGHAA